MKQDRGLGSKHPWALCMTNRRRIEIIRSKMQIQMIRSIWHQSIYSYVTDQYIFRQQTSHCLNQKWHIINWPAIKLWQFPFTKWIWTCRLQNGDHLFICLPHYGDVIMGAIASQITSLTIVYSTVYSDADERKHQSSASVAFVWGIHRGPVNSPHKWPVTRKIFSFDDVIMAYMR